MDVSGIGAIVTGAASGLGGATARHLAGLGALVTIFDLDAGRGAALAEEIGGAFARVDVRDVTSVRSGLDGAIRMAPK